MAAKRKASAPGYSGLVAIVIKAMGQISYDHLAAVIRATGCLLVAHLTLKKRPIVNMEVDTCPLALEEALAKVIATMLLEHTPSWVEDHRVAYQPGRSTVEVPREGHHAAGPREGAAPRPSDIKAG